MTWLGFERVATVTSFASGLISGATNVVGGYKTYVVPKNTLVESWDKIAAENGLIPSFDFQPTIVRSLRDRYCFLVKQYEESSGLDRHLPSTQFRNRVQDLADDIQAIYLDTLVITVLLPDVRPIKSLASDNDRVGHGRIKAGCPRELSGDTARQLSRCLPNWVGINITRFANHT
ncbi:hypothetical protein BJY52DRAFT_1268726 [Lactarius psammicola]|nr:hypothetical protein BJY52DRAFT_1268726 [Lactarius psammicola]